MISKNTLRNGVKPLLSSLSISIIAVSLAACGGNSSSSRATGPTLNADNAATVAQTVLLGHQMVAAFTQLPIMIAQDSITDEACIDDQGTVSVQWNDDTPGTVSFSECLVQDDQEQQTFLNGSFTIEAQEQDSGSPSGFPNGQVRYDNFNLRNMVQHHEDASSVIVAHIDGSITIDLDTDNATGSMLASITLSVGASHQGEGAPPPSNFELRYIDYFTEIDTDAGLGTLMSISGGVYIAPLVNDQLAITTHEGFAQGSCEYGDITIAGRNSSLNIRFTGDSALVTLNGVTEHHDTCEDFGDWLMSGDPLMFGLR